MSSGPFEVDDDLGEEAPDEFDADVDYPPYPYFPGKEWNFLYIPGNLVGVMS